MVAAANLPTCANSACRIAETGKCVEGLPLQQCSHYGRRPGPEPLGSEANRLDGIALATGERLSLNEADLIMCTSDTRCVAVIGPRDAGKTSLIAGLFGLFLDGPVGDWSFSAGPTLRAFEVACHDARAVSKRTAPHFERTPRGPAGLYHLTLSAHPDAAPIELLIADRAGEEYLELLDDTSATAERPELRRADVITLLVDGKRLLDVGARHNLLGDLGLMLQALHDGGSLVGNQRLAIVLTKHDEFDGSPDMERAERDFASFVAKMRGLFGRSFSVIEAFRLAASPETDARRRGAGVSDLLAFWMQPALPSRPEIRGEVRPARAFGRLPATME